MVSTFKSVIALTKSCYIRNISLIGLPDQKVPAQRRAFAIIITRGKEAVLFTIFLGYKRKTFTNMVYYLVPVVIRERTSLILKRLFVIRLYYSSHFINRTSYSNVTT